MEIKALIVDDEAPARAELRYMLEKMTNVKVVGEATSAEEALELVQAIEYDVIFLDIQMPSLSGIDLASEIKQLPRHPFIVFVTAYSEHAVKAFELEAIDYLVKPFEEERLIKTIAKIVKIKAKEPLVATTISEIERVPVQSKDKTILLPVKEIVFANSNEENVIVHTFKNRYSTKYSLKDLERKLAKKGFFRVHRSYLVNLHHVEEIIPMFGRTYILRVKCTHHTEIPVSRRRGPKLKTILGM
jgi:DNA-binding LytR/AlgR family response regulator